MLQKKAEGFDWTAKSEEAALLVAEDKLTDEQIAERVKVKRMTLHRWKQHPDFKLRVEQNVEAMRRAILTQGIADKSKRVARLNRDWEGLQQVINARAESAQRYIKRNGKEEYPGMATGQVVRTETPVKHGEKVEYRVDTATLAELRAMEQQAAKEVGDWIEKYDLQSRSDAELLADALAAGIIVGIAAPGEDTDTQEDGQ